MNRLSDLDFRCELNTFLIYFNYDQRYRTYLKIIAIKLAPQEVKQLLFED